MKDVLRWLLSVTILIFVVCAVGMLALWLLGARRIDFDYDPLARYFLTIATTFFTYRFASFVARGKSGLWPYLQWVIIAGLVSWGCAALLRKYTGGDLPGIGDIATLTSSERSTAFLKIYPALVVVGMAGTSQGMREKREGIGYGRLRHGQS